MSVKYALNVSHLYVSLDMLFMSSCIETKMSIDAAAAEVEIAEESVGLPEDPESNESKTEVDVSSLLIVH